MSTVNLVNDMRNIYNTKIAIKDALGTESDVFADYPGYILDYNTRLSYVEEHKADIEDIPSLDGYATEAYVNSAIAGVSIDLSSYVTKDELSAQSYLTQHQDLSDYAQKSYVVDYVNTYAPTPDLSGYATKAELGSYVSKSELSSCSYITLNDIPSVDLSSYVSYDYANANYVSYSYLGNVEELVEYIIGTGSGSAPENIYATKAELASYVSYSYLEEALSEIDVDIDLSSYVSKDELDSAAYITAEDIPVIDLSSYVTKDELSAQSYLTSHQDLSSYATKSYVVDYVAAYAPTPDLSSYVSKTELSSLGYITSIPSEYITQTELSSCGYITLADVPGTDLSNYVTYGYATANYVSYSYLGDIEEITEYILGSGSSSAPENIYATKAELNSYVSKTSLESMSYITESDVAEMGYITMDDIDACGYITMGDVSACGYITAGDIPSVVVPVIDENLIPKENNTYTLGDASHFYYSAYIVRLRGDSSGIWLDTNTNHRYYAGASEFKPYSNNQYNLGTSDINWSYTYTTNLILNGVNATEVFPSYAYINNVLGDIETLLSNI